MALIANDHGQDKRQAELRAAERGARDLRGARRHDVVELGWDVRGFARVVVAQIIDGDIDNKRINWPKLIHGLDPSLGCPNLPSRHCPEHPPYWRMRTPYLAATPLHPA